MKELKNKEIVIGLIVLIVLCVIALGLIIKREFPQEKGSQMAEHLVVAEEAAEEEILAEDGAAGNAVAVDEQEVSIKEVEGKRQNTNTQDSGQAKKQAADKEILLEQEKIESLALGTQAVQVDEFAQPPVYAEYTGEEMWQLEELYGYWKDYQLEAVDDLIRLPRVRTLTNELSETSRFYYYGDTNADGLPHGSGLAVYADNAYYCGEWKNGKRHGKGMWLQIFPDKTVTLNGVPGVTEHSYNGEWANDYPNGEGQEHISYEEEEMDGDPVITNVIGGFKDGYYDGSLYIMAFDKHGDVTDWEADAKKGAFNYYHNRYSASGKLPVWKEMIDEEEDVFHWLDESENINWGIFGLKKMN